MQMTRSQRLRQRLAAVCRPNSDSGAVAVLVAILALVIFGMAAFAVDLGHAYSVKRQLSVTADASALAGARAAGQQFSVDRLAGLGCDTASLSPVATAAAIELHNANGPKDSDGDPSVTVSCEPDGTILVAVNNSSTLNTFFAGVFGFETLNPATAAVARVSGSPGYAGLRPYAVCETEIDGLTTGDTYQSLYGSGQAQEDQPCQFTPSGNWGLVDFDDGSNPNGDIADWTAYGYDGTVTIPDDEMSGDPGANFNSATIKTALASIVDQTVLLPVASTWQTDGGNNANFVAVGVVSATICGAQVGNWQTTGACWDQEQADATDLQPNDLIVQWQFQDYATSYSSSGTGDECDLSSANCVPTVRLWE
jgi:Flp pilus assembly protein TadG